MRIEEVTEEALAKLTDTELFNLRLRAVQVFNKHFDGTSAASTGTLRRSKLLSQYEALRREMHKRGLHPTWEGLDGYLLRHKMMQGLDPALMGDIVLDPACVVVAGPFAHDPKGTEVCDLFVSPGLGFTEEIQQALSTRVTKQISKLVKFHFGQESLGDVYMPMFDLVLRPRPILEKVTKQRDISKDHVDEAGVCHCPDCATSMLYEAPEGFSQTKCMDCGAFMTDVEPPISKAYIDDELVVQKPGFEETENEVRYRIREPGRFQEGSFRRIALQQSKPRVYGIIGRLKGETTTTLQALRFPKGDGWTIPKARAWVKDHPSVVKKEFDPLEKGAVEFVRNSEIDIDESADKKEAPLDYVVRKVEAEHVVGGVIYEPMTEDAQGDFTDAEEIRKAMYFFMENSQRIKVMHKGRAIRAKILECFQVPVDYELEGEPIRAGSWWLTVRVRDEQAWKAVEAGEITGFSMGGVAREV